MGFFSWIANIFNKTIALFKEFLTIVFNKVTESALAQIRQFAIDTIRSLSIEDMTDEEKRKEAFKRIKAEAISKGINLRDSLINLLIELAVVYLKNLAGE